MLNPQHIIPAHADMKMTAGYADFAAELGYTFDNDVHLMRNGQRLMIK